MLEFTDDNRFFKPLVVALTGLYSYSTMRNAQINGHASGVRHGEKAVIFGKQTSGVQLSIELADFLDPVSRNQWPEKIIFEEDVLDEPEKAPGTMATGGMGITWSLMGHCYLTYFEHLSDLIENAEGRDWTRWSKEIWKFGYQTRNAVAHSGEVYFKNPNAPNVNWRNLTYSPQDNGKRIFDDIGVVEFILLMNELDTSV